MPLFDLLFISHLPATHSLNRTILSKFSLKQRTYLSKYFSGSDLT
ncbi:hypothetical protein FICEBENF_03251 [Aeromonas hydrophila]